MTFDFLLALSPSNFKTTGIPLEKTLAWLKSEHREPGRVKRPSLLKRARAVTLKVQHTTIRSKAVATIKSISGTFEVQPESHTHFI